MTRTAGSRVGPYEIIGAIGAGGMGEVYRARDTKLNRDVAIKVLLPAVANDPDRLARTSIRGCRQTARASPWTFVIRRTTSGCGT